MGTILEQILDHVPWPIWWKNTEGVYNYVNPAFTDLMETTIEKVVGKKDIDLWPRVFALHFTADDRVVMQTREVVKFVEELPNRKWVETIKVPIVRENEVVGTVGISRDITEERAFTTNIQASIERLGKLIGEAV